MRDIYKEQLRKIADLCNIASEEICTENDEEEAILSKCDELVDMIDEYLGE